MDGLLETLENDPAYRCFVMDGQCVVIEDYLEARPENRERVCKQVAAGRLAIGPWYTLPDLYPLDGECLVRNLLRGMRVSKKYGECLGVGYNSFGWGQTAQFPQIYKSFGFEFLVAGKNVSRERAPKCEFIWEGPDGTRLLTTRLGPFARANMFFNACIPVRFGVDYIGGKARHEWGERGGVMHNATPDRCHEDYSRLAGDPGYYPEYLESGLRKAWDSLDETTVPDCRLLMSGSDFTDCQPYLTPLLKDANASFEDVEFVHSTLEDYAAEFVKHAELDALPVVKGELRDGPACDCSANALAVRSYLKVANRKAQNTILRKTEPLATALAMLGAEYPDRLLDIAWKYLLRAQAHDSINGVTQDKTADDTLHRLRQAQEIGDALYDEAVAGLARKIDLSRYDSGDILVLAVNPLPFPVPGVVELCVDTPREQGVWEFELAADGGRICAVQHLSRVEKTSPVNDPEARPWPFYHDRHMVYADLGELPGCGYGVFKVVPTVTRDREVEWWPPMRTSRGDEISGAPGSMENEHLRVAVEANGTVTLTDKASGREYSGLNMFEDAGDAGDYWAYYPPDIDEVHTSLVSRARVWLEENGPLAATTVVETVLTIPARGTCSRGDTRMESRRSEETRDLLITSRLTLKRGARRLDITTCVENTVEDHRFRVLFPTDIEATNSCASGHFTVDTRPVDPGRGSDGTFYPEMQTMPQQHFVDISDGKQGLAILNNSVMEYEVLRDERTTLALTLFRSVRNRICTEFRSTGEFPHEKGGQSLRSMAFGYSLFPHTGTWKDGGVYCEAEAFNVSPAVFQTSFHPGGDLAPSTGFLTVEPDNLVMSAFKKAEDRASFILRLFNPTDEPIAGRVSLSLPIGTVHETGLDENRTGNIDLAADGTINLSVPRGKIVTLELVPAGNQDV